MYTEFRASPERQDRARAVYRSLFIVSHDLEHQVLEPDIETDFGYILCVPCLRRPCNRCTGLGGFDRQIGPVLGRGRGGFHFRHLGPSSDEVEADPDHQYVAQ